jgi:energy-coupling factor transporter ATP-binding protein EcfA2
MLKQLAYAKCFQFDVRYLKPIGNNHRFSNGMPMVLKYLSVMLHSYHCIYYLERMLVVSNIEVDISNCNNIDNGHFLIEKGKLNIKYGMNGTGKSTIATALELSSKKQPLTPLKSFGADEDEEATVDVSEPLGNVFVFNEEFVNTLVFQERSLIENAFDVFIKTPDYDERRASLDSRLKELKVDIGKDERILQLRADLQEFADKLRLTKSKTELTRNSNLKSILKKDNLFNIPSPLQKYSPFISDDSLSINWIDWKTKGEQFDAKGICPFCSVKLKPTYEEEKQIFNSTYQKADSQNLKNMLDLFIRFKKYLDPSKYEELISCIKRDIDEDTIRTVLLTIRLEVEHLKVKLDSIEQFDSNVFRDVDIKKIDELLDSLKIKGFAINYLCSPFMTEIIDFVNLHIKSLEKEVAELKGDMGRLRSLIQNTIQTSLYDINLFLESAGIQYEVSLDFNDDGKTLARLKYRKGEEKVGIENIRNHLSWGERNAFALILFMFYALSQNPDLIVLDDPISSFDSNKKYAIIHRLFSKNKNRATKSFYKKTVLMLTHDFEPLIDFVVVGKLPIEYVCATFINNCKGTFSERAIEAKTDIRSIIHGLLLYINDDSLNMVYRVVFLRKYYEHHGIENNKDAYDVLSSLIHGRTIAADRNETKLPVNVLKNGTKEIKKHITEFDYTQFIQNYFNEKKLVDFYFAEDKAYLKLQLFRALKQIVPFPDVEENDTLIKFINESYHIENDYAYYLDIIEFDMVPSYIIDEIDSFMKAQYRSVS